jgi:hypothetical protein
MENNFYGVFSLNFRGFSRGGGASLYTFRFADFLTHIIIQNGDIFCTYKMPRCETKTREYREMVAGGVGGGEVNIF